MTHQHGSSGGGAPRGRPPSGQRLGTPDLSGMAGSKHVTPPEPNVQLAVVGSAVDTHQSHSLQTRPSLGAHGKSSSGNASSSRIPKPTEVYAAAVAELHDADSKSLLKLQQLRTTTGSSSPGSPMRKRASSAYAPGALPALPNSPTATALVSRQSRQTDTPGASILSGQKRLEEQRTGALITTAQLMPSMGEIPSQIPSSPGAVRRITSAPDSQSAQRLAQQLTSGHQDPWRPVLHEPLRTGPRLESHASAHQVLYPPSTSSQSPQQDQHGQPLRQGLSLQGTGTTSALQQSMTATNQRPAQEPTAAQNQSPGAVQPPQSTQLLCSAGAAQMGSSQMSPQLQAGVVSSQMSPQFQAGLMPRGPGPGGGTFMPAMGIGLRRTGPAGICTAFSSPRSGESSPGILTPSTATQPPVRVARSPSSPQGPYAAASQLAGSQLSRTNSASPSSTPPGSGLWPRPPSSTPGAAEAMPAPSRLSSPPVHAARRRFEALTSPDACKSGSPLAVTDCATGKDLSNLSQGGTAESQLANQRDVSNLEPTNIDSTGTGLLTLPSVSSTGSNTNSSTTICAPVTGAQSGGMITSGGVSSASGGPSALVVQAVNSTGGAVTSLSGVSGAPALNSLSSVSGAPALNSLSSVSGAPALNSLSSISGAPALNISGRWLALDSAGSSGGGASQLPTPSSRPSSGRGRAVQVLMDAVRSKDNTRFKEVMEYLRLPNGSIAGLNDRHTVTGRTPLHEAVMQNNTDVVRALLAAGADPHVGHMSQGPPLLHAAAWGESAMVRLLLSAGADLHARDIAGYTALHYACAGGHVDTARVLLEQGADPKASAHDGDTALALAAEHPTLLQQLFGLSASDIAELEARPSLQYHGQDDCDITLSPANSTQLTAQLHPSSEQAACSSGQGSQVSNGNRQDYSSKQAQQQPTYSPMPPGFELPRSNLSNSFRLRGLTLDDASSPRAAGPSPFAAQGGFTPPPQPSSSTPTASSPLGQPLTSHPSTTSTAPLLSPTSESEDRGMPPAPPALELPRGVMRQLSKGAVLQDIIHAFQDDDNELVKRASATGEALFGRPSRAAPGQGGGFSLLDGLERKLSTRPSGEMTPTGSTGGAAPIQRQPSQSTPPAQPLANGAIAVTRVASFTSQGGGGSVANSPRGLAAAVPTTPRFRFGVDIHKNPPLQHSGQLLVQAVVLPGPSLTDGSHQSEQGAAQQCDAAARHDEACIVAAAAVVTPAATAAAPQQELTGDTRQCDSVDPPARASTAGLVVEATFCDRGPRESVASRDATGSAETASNPAGPCIMDRSGDITPPLVSDHSPPPSPHLNASIRRRAAGAGAISPGKELPPKSPKGAMAASHSGIPAASSDVRAADGHEAASSALPTRHSLGAGAITDRANSMSRPTSATPVSQAAHALAVRVGAPGGSSEALQLRALQMFHRSMELQTGGMKWTRGELLGEGSYGRVYAGLNQETGELMAVKVLELLLKSRGAKEVALAQLNQLMQELELYKKLSHAHVVSYIDHFFEPATTTLYIFLEYVPGGSIASMLGRFGRFSEELVRNYTRQLLLGLDYLHSSRIVHRDLKGGNVLVTRDGVVKLADFGASKACSSDTINDGMKSIKGSVFWMAPEVIKGTGYNQKADIWSLGCTVIEMLTGQHPWPQLDNALTAMFQIAKQTSGPPRPTNASALAQDFVDCCLRYDPQDRPSAAELLHHTFMAVPAETPKARRNSKLAVPSPQ